MTGETNRSGQDAAERNSARILAQTQDVRVSLQELACGWPIRPVACPLRGGRHLRLCAGDDPHRAAWAAETHVLRPGEMFVIGAGREDRVTSAARCLYVNVQAGGRYDSLPR
jgi:hypothetical protein